MESDLMRPIDMLSAYIIAGVGSLLGAMMMLIARQAEPSQRAPLNQCLYGFLILGVGLAHNAFTDTAVRWPILFGAAASLVGTALIARGLGWMVSARPPRFGALPTAVLLAGLVIAAWPLPPRWFGIVFHAIFLMFAASLAYATRHALLRPRSAAERAVGVICALYALTWAQTLWYAIGYRGPELRHLMYMPEPMLTMFAVTYALMPLLVGALVLNLANAQLGARLNRLASTDELTGLLTRRALHERAQLWHAEVRARGQTPALLLVDIDYFKQINDSHGHECGDAVLRAVSGRMRGHLRGDALIARWGGEEFLVLLEASHCRDAAAAAERLRAAVGDAPFSIGALRVPVTASLGLAAWTDDTQFARAVAAADAALYTAKRGGRNRVAIADACEPADALSATAAASRRTP
ncbi:GGDEF domain-containing protein [Lysobacter korlensis]|uniref:diguanylate cyclase n=1 Tax=Lysobacter korlensis TaxID=553636 RepID=A0ABV6RHF7_9GAMM